MPNIDSNLSRTSNFLSAIPTSAARDFLSIRAEMLALITYLNPEWTARSNSDPGITLLELNAFILDTFHFTLDMIYRDLLFKTSFSREAVISYMELLAYLHSSASPASVDITYTLSQAQDTSISIPQYAQTQTSSTPPKYFENDAALTIPGPDFVDTTTGNGTKTTIKVADSGLYDVGDLLEVGQDLISRIVTSKPDATTVEFLNNPLSSTSTSGLKVRNYGISLSSIPISVTGPATEGKTTTASSVYTGDGSKLQETKLSFYPIIDGSLKVYVDEGSGNIQYTQATNNRLLSHSSSERVFEISKDDIDRITIRFGDGINGLKLGVGWTVDISCRIGGGNSGNIDEQEISTLNTSISVSGTVSVNNKHKASGGGPRETIAEMKRNGPANLSNLTGNIVSITDYVSAAEAVSGVQKAQAHKIGFNRINIYIVPDGASGSIPSSSLLNSVQSVLNSDSTRLVGFEAVALPPKYVTIDIEGRIFIRDNFRQDEQRENVKSRVASFFSPTNRQFGKTGDRKTGIHIGDFYHFIEDITGVDYCEFYKFSRRPSLNQRRWSGNATISSIETTENTKKGRWIITFLSPTTFSVLSPSGITATGVVGTSFSSQNNEISFTITAGATPMIEGDNAFIDTSDYLSKTIELNDAEFPIQGNSIGTSVETISIFGGLQ